MLSRELQSLPTLASDAHPYMLALLISSSARYAICTQAAAV